VRAFAKKLSKLDACEDRKVLRWCRTQAGAHAGGSEGARVGLPYVRLFPDMSGILVAKYASGRNVKQCFIVRDFGIMPFMKSNRNVFTVRII